MAWTPESAMKAAHAAGFAGRCWTMGPEELARLLNRAVPGFETEPAMYIHLNVDGKIIATQSDPIPEKRILAGDRIETLHRKRR